MSWTLVIWLMSAGVCITLAAVHLLLWLRDRNAQASLAFSLWTTAVAISALFELAMMHSPTQEKYAVLLGAAAFPFAVMTIAYIAFIRLYLRAGRRWLMWSIFGIVALELLVKVTVLPTLPFVEIADLQHIPLWGETLVAPVGVKSPWSWITGLLVMLELAFIGNAAVEAWRGDGRRRVKIVAVAVCCSTAFSVAIAVLVMRAELPPPITFTLPSMFTILVMAYGLSSDLIKASQMSQDLRASQERMSLATYAADLSVWEWDIVRDEIWATETSRAHIAGKSDRITFNQFLESLHPDDREPTHRAVYQALEGSGGFQAEYRRVTPEGAIRWIAERGHVVRGPDGKALLVRGVSVDITERKQMDEALQISEEKFRGFFKNTPDYCYIISMEGKILHINESALKTLGYKREELVGQPVARIYAPECLAKMEDLFTRWKETGEIRDEEMVIVTRKGERRNVILNVGSVRDKDGTILHSTSVQTDITERKQAEEALAHSHSLLAAALDSTADGILVVDNAGKVSSFNRNFLNLWRIPETLIATRDDKQLLRYVLDQLQNPEGFLNKVLAIYQTTDASPIEELAFKDGRIFERYSHPQRLGETIVGRVWSFRDVTARKQAEAALKQSEERLKEAQRIAHIGNWELRLLTNTLTWSDEIFRIFEIDKERFDATYEAFLATVHPEDREAVNTAYTQSLETHTPYAITHRLLMPDGRVKYVHEQCETFYSPEGKPLRSVGTVQDITEQKRAEIEITRARAELLRVERSLRLSELTASLAHELNQPLAAILSNAQAALRFLKSDKPNLNEFQEIIQDIISDDQRAGNVIRSLRSMMRREEGEKKPTILNDVLNSVIQIFRSEAIFRNVHIETELDESLPPVLGDKSQLQQVILNIVMNGAEAMSENPPEHRKLILRTQRRDHGIWVSVRDFGPGIDQENLERVFQPFFTTKGAGFGMGLAVCSSIIKDHGGRIWPENNPDGGATFFVELPVIRNSDQ